MLTNKSASALLAIALQHLQVQDAGSLLKATFTLQKGAYCTVKEDGDDLVLEFVELTLSTNQLAIHTLLPFAACT